MEEFWRQRFHDHSTSSFVEILRSISPSLLPVALGASSEGQSQEQIPHGTTVLALKYRDGVIMAGDRQATEGYQVAHRRIEKVYKADEYSAVGIAGAAGPSIEMARLFQTELRNLPTLPDQRNTHLKPDRHHSLHGGCPDFAQAP